jgi:hypothetical protein
MGSLNWFRVRPKWIETKDSLGLAENMAQYWRYAKWHVNGLIENPGNDLMSEFIKELRKPENVDLCSFEYL